MTQLVHQLIKKLVLQILFQNIPTYIALDGTAQTITGSTAVNNTATSHYKWFILVVQLVLLQLQLVNLLLCPLTDKWKNIYFGYDITAPSSGSILIEWNIIGMRGNGVTPQTLTGAGAVV